MKTINDPAQQRLFDPFEGVISRTGWKQIENGWQSLFRDVLLEQMPVQRIAADMSDSAGRPSAELHSMIGLILIRELYGWTVPQAHEAILFRADIQYALNLEPGVDITQRTIERDLQKMQNDEQLSEGWSEISIATKLPPKSGRMHARIRAQGQRCARPAIDRVRRAIIEKCRNRRPTSELHLRFQTTKASALASPIRC